LNNCAGVFTCKVVSAVKYLLSIHYVNHTIKGYPFSPVSQLKDKTGSLTYLSRKSEQFLLLVSNLSGILLGFGLEHCICLVTRLKFVMLVKIY